MKFQDMKIDLSLLKQYVDELDPLINKVNDRSSEELASTYVDSARILGLISSISEEAKLLFGDVTVILSQITMLSVVKNKTEEEVKPVKKTRSKKSKNKISVFDSENDEKLPELTVFLKTDKNVLN